MERINNLEDFSKNIQFITKYKKLFDYEVDNLNILNKYVNSLTDSESHYDIYAAIKKDINENVKLYESILLTMNDKFFPLKIEKIEDSNIFQFGNLKLRTTFNEKYFLQYKDQIEIELNREEIQETLRNVLYTEVFEKPYKDTPSFRKITPPRRGIYKDEWDLNFVYETLRNVDRMYNKKDKWIYAKEFPRKKEFEILIEQGIDKLNKSFEKFVDKDLILEYLEIVEGKEAARVTDVKQDSIVIKKDQKTNKIEITQNPKNKIVPNQILEIIKDIPHLNNLELDVSTDFNKLKFLLSEIKTANINTKEPYTFKTRLLGKHNVNEIYFKGNDKSEEALFKHIVAIDLRNSFSFIKGLSKHIILTTDMDNLKDFVHYLDKTNTYNGVMDSNVAKYSTNVEILSRGAEISYSLNQGKFLQILELERLKKEETLNIEKINQLKTELKIENENEYKWQEVLLNNSTNNGLVRDFKEYLEDKEDIYFDIENMSLSRAENIYVFYQDLLSFENKIDKKINLNNSKEGSYERETVSRNYSRREGIETYTKEDFENVRDLINNKDITNIELKELCEEGLNISYKKAKISGLSSFIHKEIMDKELQIENNVLTIDTYEEIDYEKPIVYIKGIDFYSDIERNMKVFEDISKNNNKYLNKMFDLSNIFNKYDKQIPEEVFKNTFLKNLDSESMYSLFRKGIFKQDNFKDIMLGYLKDENTDFEFWKTTIEFLDSQLRYQSDPYSRYFFVNNLGTNLSKYSNKLEDKDVEILDLYFEKLNSIPNKEVRENMKRRFMKSTYKDFKIEHNTSNDIIYDKIILSQSNYFSRSPISISELDRIMKNVDIRVLKDRIDKHILYIEEETQKTEKESGNKYNPAERYKSSATYGGCMSFAEIENNSIKDSFIKKVETLLKKLEKETKQETKISSKKTNSLTNN